MTARALLLATLLLAGPAAARAQSPLLPNLPALSIPGLSPAEIATVPDAPRRAGCAVKSGQLAPALAQARNKLGITPAQQGAWTRATHEITDAVAPLAAECDRPAPPPGSLAATMDRLRGDAALAAALSRLQAAGQTLYNALTPQQQAMINQASGSLRNSLPGIIAGQTGH